MRFDGGGVEAREVRTRIAGHEGTAELTLDAAVGVDLSEDERGW
jgi:hypothetical protein